MAYKAKEDKVLKTIRAKGEGSLFFLEIKSYKDGPAKVQLRRVFLNADGEQKNGTVGRLSVKDLEFLQKKIKKTIRLVNEFNGAEEGGKEEGVKG